MALALPILFVALVWFISTGAIIWLDNRDPETYGGSLVGATVVTGFAVCGVLISLNDSSAGGAYLAFAAATAIWGWHEMSFLMGFVSGPNRSECPPGLSGWARFKVASATVIHHEIALAATALALYAVSWGHPNMLAAHVFGLLFTMRLSSKFNIFFGVANFSADIMPPHLGYLKSYFRAAPMNAFFPLSLAGSAALTWYFLDAARTGQPGSGASVGAMMLFTLVALALLEHAFLMMPLRDSALWDWFSPKGSSAPARIARLD
jgi:putative photosynthetic complex assembly protein 2